MPATGHTYEVNIGASVGRRPDVEYYLERWRLKRDGESFATSSSVLAPVCYYGNVLDFAGAGAGAGAGSGSGWLAIDPKHIIGDRAFDFANILCNPVRTAGQAGRRHCGCRGA